MSKALFQLSESAQPHSFRGDARGADDTREDPAEEVGTANQERRGDGEERRHRRGGSIAVTTRDPCTSMRARLRAAGPGRVEADGGFSPYGGVTEVELAR